MNFQIPDSVKEIQQLVRSFAEEVIAPRAKEIDEKDEFFPDIMQAAGEMGILAMELPESVGGIDSGALATVICNEEIARVSAAVCNVIGAVRLQLSLIHQFGSKAQRENWIPALSSGKKIGSFAITEPGAGSDVSNIKTTAVKKGDYWVINGSKCFITLGPVADMVIVLTKTDPSKGVRGMTSFLVEKGTPGFSAGPKEPMMGQHGIPIGQLYFDNCCVPVENMLGEEGQGFKIMMSGLDGTRLDIAALSLGLSQAAYEMAAAYAASRKQFGQEIGNFQGVGFMLADMATEIDAGRFLLYRGAQLRDAGLPFTKEASMAKYYCSDNAMRHTTNAVQIFGGYGYSKEYPLERYMRDAKICQIYDGTSQIHRMIITRKIMQEQKEKGL
ncbi:acyl-CoA dehydrogenase family protein [Ammoniphilus resinae]|uniref:Alkylation response protein AidB-like acyl-CoA dehydrogenase n=1 Tax=Ammoniphilus resinae TaxID=861532 RepID=A0ABS4GTS2_9BACL|nr:acyl-CoA dehydrogenase family protein [Ammoniphilus resinae]MBP1933641.1 alkylation response protein AidB-like acyl-CoA dehydrogenase [Ammoniphilus resinae]